MAIAAVPAYLGEDFRNASPGLRFGFLLPIWTTRQDQQDQVNQRAQARSREGREISETLRRHGMDAAIAELRERDRNRLPGLWDKNDFAARHTWSIIGTLTPLDRDRMKALADRQSMLAVTLGADDSLPIKAIAIAPFTTGLGNEHPLENGFAFLNPYGLPYLPGSGVKGVVHLAARELASEEWGDGRGWSKEKCYSLTIDRKALPLSAMDILFGHEPPAGEQHHIRGTLSFWDVIPQIEGDSLLVEIMTPHQSHYYQWKKDQRGNEIQVSPHDSGQPNPICFLTVPPKSGFNFHVVCDTQRLQRLAPDLAEGQRWKALLEAAFAHAFDWLGFGAKTAVGYGAMAREGQGNPEQTTAEAQRAPSQSVAEEIWAGATLRLDAGSGRVSATAPGKSTASATGEAAKAFRNSLPSELADRLKKNKELKNMDVRVRVEGNARTVIAVVARDES